MHHDREFDDNEVDSFTGFHVLPAHNRLVFRRAASKVDYNDILQFEMFVLWYHDVGRSSINSSKETLLPLEARMVPHDAEARLFGSRRECIRHQTPRNGTACPGALGT